MLIISLILLVVISLLTVTSMRNAASSESVAGNVRKTELATQAAEIALRFCEEYVVNFIDTAAVLPIDIALLLEAEVNQTGIAKTYKRPPECLIEMQQPAEGASDVLTRTSSFVITARGFGPEVAEADSKRSRPQGSEVWLQSHIQTQ